MASRLAVAAALLSLIAATASADPSAPSVAVTAATRATQDVEVAELLRRLGDSVPKGLIRIDNVRIVNPRDGSVRPNSTIFVRGSRIRWVGDTAAAPNPPGATRIDGRGGFAIPGLADMHIHSGRADGYLLNLAAGVTTVRDMDGFPWILRARDRINAGAMPGPTTYVAGTIIASEPLDGYAVVVPNPTTARTLVRQQAACGYDFIKVHNQLPQPMFDAVAEQAAALGMDLVGHIPHDVTIDHALHSGKMRTTEHLKGFLDDSTLLPGAEDYAAALRGATTWITPTLYTRRGWDRGPLARSLLGSPEARYVPPQVRSQWAAALANPDPDDLKLGARFVETQGVVMKRLLPLKPHWLTGTDAAGYPFNIMGFALLDELQLLQQAGLSPAESYRAATIEAADALRETGEFGALEKGMRADIVLLDSNPLEDGQAFKANRGVMAHGQWFDRASLDAALKRLADLYAGSPRPIPASELVNRLESAVRAGFVFDDGMLGALSAELGKAGSTALAERVHALEVSPTMGVCSVPNPEQ
jgi:hypothetical protein